MNTILIVSHDAGGAEVLSSWVKYHLSYRYIFVLEGPAKEIFKKKVPIDLINHERKDLFDLINTSDQILTSTSGEADLERIAIIIGKRLNKKTISLLDHWCEYTERFIQDGISVWPDELWVCDNYAYDIAKKLFFRINIVLQNNYYLLDFKNEMEAYKKNRRAVGLNILYICEPVADYALQKYNDAYYFNYDEYTALTYFFDFLQTANYKGRIEKVRIRLHPLEKKNKYDHILKNSPFLLDISEFTLMEDFSWADWVVGCSSMALAQAIFAGKKAYTCIPPSANVFKFPHVEIEALPQENKMEEYNEC